MKRILILACILMACISVSGQCKYKVDKIDEFTGEKIITTKSATIAKSFGTFISVKFTIVDNVVFLDADVFGKEFECISKSSKLYLKLGNDSVELLEHIGDIDCTGGQYPIKRFFSVVTSEQLDRLSSVNLISVRIVASNGTKDYKAKDWAKFMKRAKCIKARL